MKALLFSLALLTSPQSFANFIDVPSSTIEYQARFRPQIGAFVLNAGIFQIYSQFAQLSWYGRVGNETTMTMKALGFSKDSSSLEFLATLDQTETFGRIFLTSAPQINVRVGFRPESCEGRPIEGDIDLSSATLQQIMDSLESIVPEKAFYCDLVQTTADAIQPLKTGHHLGPIGRLRLYQEGSMEIFAKGSIRSYDTPDISYVLTEKLVTPVRIEPRRRGAPAPAPAPVASSTISEETMARVEELTFLIKEYARVLMNSEADSARREIAVRSYLQQNGARLKTLRQALNAESGKMRLIDLFTVLGPINKAYLHIKALERALNSQANLDTVTQSWGN